MAHEFFEVGADGFVEILDEQPTEDHRQDIAAAVDSCPVLALTLAD